MIKKCSNYFDNFDVEGCYGACYIPGVMIAAAAAAVSLVAFGFFSEGCHPWTFVNQSNGCLVGQYSLLVVAGGLVYSGFVFIIYTLCTQSGCAKICPSNNRL